MGYNMCDVVLPLTQRWSHLVMELGPRASTNLTTHRTHFFYAMLVLSNFAKCSATTGLLK